MVDEMEVSCVAGLPTVVTGGMAFPPLPSPLSLDGCGTGASLDSGRLEISPRASFPSSFSQRAPRPPGLAEALSEGELVTPTAGSSRWTRLQAGAA